MDAVDYLMTRERMCRNIQDCHECELKKNKCCSGFNTKAKAEKAVAFVEKWSKKHPKKTRQSEFLKAYPNAVLSIHDNHPSIDPCKLEGLVYYESKCGNICCSECREQYWTEEIE